MPIEFPSDSVTISAQANTIVFPMTSFTQSLQTYRSGNISPDDLFMEVDHILADGQEDAAWLLYTLATLSYEDGKPPLPAEIYSILRAKLEATAQNEIDAVISSVGYLKSVSHATGDIVPTSAYQPDSLQDPEIDASILGRITPNDDDINPIKGTGDVLNNRFELQECVGSGGMSTVYKAVDRRKIEADDRHPHVAIKVLNLEFRAHPDSLTALQREAKKCQILAHPNIVRVYDFDRDDSTVYMTMEFLSGMSLGCKMREHGFTGMPPDEALRIINHAGQALRFAHASGIVHADFKPANVFITDEGQIKVIDFGIARAFPHDNMAEMDETRFDPANLQALTPTYASPEMLKQQQPHPRDDIYALACTAYELLTGRHPFGRVAANTAGEAGMILQRHKALTRSQFIALKQALEFSREKRTATVDQFLKELNQTKGTSGKSATAVGLIGLLVSIAAGYNSLPGIDQSVFQELGAKTRDKQTTGKATNANSPLVSPAPAKTSTQKNSQQRIVEQASPFPVAPAINLEIEYDIRFWNTIKDSDIAADYQAYLVSFPNGYFASKAKLRAAQLTQSIKAPQPHDISRIEAAGAEPEVTAAPETETPSQPDDAARAALSKLW